jgi:hypothetical protein
MVWPLSVASYDRNDVSDDDLSSLRAENARLREENERLQAIAYPPPPTEREPDSASKAPKRMTCYLLASPKAPSELANVCRQQIRERMSEVDWEVIYRVADLPEAAYAVTVSDYITAGFGGGQFPGGNVRWYRRSSDERLEFTPTRQQTEAYTGAAAEILEGVDALLKLAEEVGPYGYGYLLMVDVVLAGLKLAEAQFRAAEDWQEAIEKAGLALTEHRAEIDAKVAELRASALT